MKVLLYPGLIVQMITTKQPSDDMIEVAIVSMEQALEADGESIPAGSAPLERSPLPPPGVGLRDPDAPNVITESAAPAPIARAWGGVAVTAPIATRRARRGSSARIRSASRNKPSSN